MNAYLVDGPFAGEEREIMDGDGIEPRVLVGRCACCDKVAVVAPGGPVQGALDAEGVILVTYYVARYQRGDMTLRRTVAYEVARDDPAQEQLAADLGKLVPA